MRRVNPARQNSRSNETHESSTDADTKLYRKGKSASEVHFMGHTLGNNRHNLIASAVVTRVDGYAEFSDEEVLLQE